ncbi:MAG: hypothetical protein SPL30_09775 [Succinivibrio sp.]|jgi:hypothetical protein|nr:hypothetical protein [Succinivibrio sp.]
MPLSKLRKAAAAALSLCALPLCQAQDFALVAGDRISFGDEWKVEKAESPKADQLGTLLTAGTKSGCAVRVDNTGAERKEGDTLPTPQQFDDYLGPLLAKNGTRTVSSERAESVRIGGRPALSKDYTVAISGAEYHVVTVQFAAPSGHLYNAHVFALNAAEFDSCRKLGFEALDGIKSSEGKADPD